MKKQTYIIWGLVVLFLVLLFSTTSIVSIFFEQASIIRENILTPPLVFQDVFIMLALSMFLVVIVLRILYHKKNIFSFKKDLLYLIGFFILGLGVNLALRSGLGAGPWDTVTYSLRALVNNQTTEDITLGNAAFIVSISVMMVVLLYRRTIKHMFMIVPLFLISLSIDLADLVILKDYVPVDWYTKGLGFTAGLLLIPAGISLIIHSTYTAFVFDELMLMFMDIFHTKKMALIRISNEAFALLLALTLGLIAGIGIGQINVGSILIAVSVGPLIALYTNFIQYIQQNPKTVETKLKYTCFYLLGSTLIAFGVVMILKSNIGLSSWDTLHYSLHKLLHITIGTATILVASLVTIFIVITKKDLQYLFMAIPIILVGGLIDLFNEVVFVNLTTTIITQRIGLYLIGLLALPLGGALLIISTFPAGVFDELMLLIMKLSKTKKMTRIRVIMELGAVTLAIVLGFLAGIGFGMVSIGTLIFSISVGVLIKGYLKLFERIGLYEFE